MKQNFDAARELAEQSPKDWKFGAQSEPGIVTIPESEREAYLPKGELQYDSKADFTDCASRSPVNHFEALFTYHYQHGMLEENKKWLDDNGYTVIDPSFGRRVEFSDRFIAVLSGTTRGGNSLKAPLETIRTRGLIPKVLLPKEDWMAWEDYYNGTAITPQLIALGKEFLTRFKLNYEQVDRALFATAVKNDMLGVAAYAWPEPVKGVYPKVNGDRFNHAFLIFNLPKYQIFDNYYDDQRLGDFTKTLAPDYVFFEWGYRAYISKEMLPVPLFKKNLGYGMTDATVRDLQRALISLGYTIPHAVTDQFLNETKAALARFQADHGIVDDGSHFGPQTRYALNKATNPADSAVGALSLFFQSFLQGFPQSLFSGV